MPSVARLEQSQPSELVADATEELNANSFVNVLETAVRQMLGNRKTKPENRLAAIVAGTKLLAIKHRIDGGDVKGFFD